MRQVWLAISGPKVESVRQGKARQSRPTQHHPFLPLIHTPARHPHPQLLHTHPITAPAPAGLPTTQRSRVTATISRTPKPAPALTSSRVDDSHDTPSTLPSDAHLAPLSLLFLYIFIYIHLIIRYLEVYASSFH